MIYHCNVNKHCRTFDQCPVSILVSCCDRRTEKKTNETPVWFSGPLQSPPYLAAHHRLAGQPVRFRNFDLSREAVPQQRRDLCVWTPAIGYGFHSRQWQLCGAIYGINIRLMAAVLAAFINSSEQSGHVTRSL